VVDPRASCVAALLHARHDRVSARVHDDGGDGDGRHLHLLFVSQSSPRGKSIDVPEDVVPEDTPASFSSFFTPPSCRGRDSAPAACTHACGSNFMTASKFSLAPFGDPGRVMMIDCFRVPATGLAINATGSSGQTWNAGVSKKNCLQGVTAYDVVSMPWLK
jgi:hypothetical protein